jgi:hypothetical protein
VGAEFRAIPISSKHGVPESLDRDRIHVGLSPWSDGGFSPATRAVIC